MMSGRKETVLDLAKFIDKGVQVKLTGGRQVTGTLKGYDQLLNLVLDEAVEFLRDTVYRHGIFWWLCQPKMDFSKLCTMHATCRVGLKSKLDELKHIFDEWKKYKQDNLS